MWKASTPDKPGIPPGITLRAKSRASRLEVPLTKRDEPKTGRPDPTASIIPSYPSLGSRRHHVLARWAR